MSDELAMSDEQTMVAEPEVEVRPEDQYSQQRKEKTKPKRQPRYNVILWDDSEHSYDYVVLMMKQLFHHPVEMGFKIAEQVDQGGKAVCLTTTMEHAELKRDQIRAFGKDELIARCTKGMYATIEPVPE